MSLLHVRMRSFNGLEYLKRKIYKLTTFYAIFQIGFN